MSEIIEYFRRRKPAILKNPYFLDDVNIAERYFDGEFDYVGWMEAPEKPLRCPCGGEAYFKVSVGAYVCVKCGKVVKDVR